MGMLIYILCHITVWARVVKSCIHHEFNTGYTRTKTELGD